MWGAWLRFQGECALPASLPYPLFVKESCGLGGASPLPWQRKAASLLPSSPWGEHQGALCQPWQKKSSDYTESAPLSL